MKFELNQPSSVGMTIEGLAGKTNGLFRPAIAFEDDNGAGSAGVTPAIDTPAAVPPNPPTATTTSDVEDVSGLKSALEKERKLRQDFEKRQKQIEEMFKGIDPEKYKELEKLQQQAEEMNQEKVKLRTELENEWTAKVKAEQQKVQEIQTQYQELQSRTQVERAYQEAFGRNGGQDGITFFDAFYTNVRSRLRPNDKGVLEVVDGNGARLFSAKDATKPMSLVEFFTTLHAHPVFGHYFGARETAKGGGMQPGSAAGYGGNLPPGEIMKISDPAERLTRLREARGA